MKMLRKIELAEIKGVWLIIKDETPTAYSQTGKDYVRFVRDILKHLELDMVLEVKERA